MRFKFFCFVIPVILLSLTVLTQAQATGTILNINHDMELGIPGPGVPGYRLLIQRIERQQVDQNPDRIYLPQTVNGGNPGQCLMIPGYQGVVNYQIKLAELSIKQACEIEITFFARIGSDELGKEHPASKYYIDFRAMPNSLVGERYYPFLKLFSFTPGSQWKRFSIRYPVTPHSNFFMLRINAVAPANQSAQNALYLDQFTITRIEPTPSLVNEMALIPDRLEPVYKQNDTVGLKLKATIHTQDKQLDAVVAIRSDLDNTLLATYPVTLKRTGSLPAARGVYQGHLGVQASKFGSYHSEVTVGKQNLWVVGGEFAVLHPTIKHPRFSPGWRIGYNNVPICPTSGSLDAAPDPTDYRWIFSGGFERSFRIVKQAGMSLQRLWGKWRYLEPSQGHWRTDVIQPILDLDRKYNLDVIYVIAGNLTVHGSKQWLQKQVAQFSNPWPKYLLKYHYDTGKKGSITPPADVFAKYLDFVIKHWGDQIDIWEATNEPGLGGFPADRYLKYLKQTYDAVKKKDPNDLVLGNGVTGDMGMNIIKWCEALNAADPNYPNYLDGVAFHPYEVTLDYQEGRYGLYSQCIADIRSKLKIPKPLWNTECFYLINARKPQIPWFLNQRRFGANEIQRHILESLLNNVQGITSLYEGSLVKQGNAPVALPVLSQVAVGTNALSYLLKGMKTLEPISFNRYIKAGLFSNPSSQTGLGFVYDLRPIGSQWHLPKDRKGVQILDLFGNPVSEDVIHLSYEPYYLLGTHAAIRSLLNAQTIQAGSSLKITGRIFKDQLYLEGHNLSGIDDYKITLAFDSPAALSMPSKLSMLFAPGKERQVMTLQHALRKGFDRSLPVNWQNTLEVGSAKKHQVRILPDTGSHDIPMSRQGALNLKLSLGSKASFTADQKALHVTLVVADNQIQNVKTDELWTGDAVEVFIDPHPFEQLDHQKVLQGHQALDVWQYVFAAKPSDNQAHTRQHVINRSRKNFTSRASHTVTFSKGQYTLTASIPWSEILSQGNLGQVIGLDIEIDHVDNDKLVKESLGSEPGQSFRERLHYPLFHIPDAVIRKYRPLLQAQKDGQNKIATGRLRIDISSQGNRIPMTFNKGSENISGVAAAWLKENSNKRLLILSPLNNQWQKLSFTFTPNRTGTVVLELMGNYKQRGSERCYMDHFVVQGAAGFRNGSFEKHDKKGVPVGWTTLNQPVLIYDVAGAAQGDFYIMTDQKNRFRQSLTVKKGQPVTVSFEARVAGVQRIFQMQ